MDPLVAPVTPFVNSRAVAIRGAKAVPVVLIAGTLLGWFSAAATAQCPGEWVASDGVTGPTPAVGALTMWDPDGAGPQAPILVVGGSFTAAGGTAANNIAIWDGETWSTLGSGMNSDVNALAVLHDGSLVAAGLFTTADGVNANFVSRWDGESWTTLGAGFNNEVFTLTVLPNGDLVAGGLFTTGDGAPASHIARWNGASWSAFGTGLGGPVYSVTVLPNGDLVAGGNYLMAGGTIVRHIARWTGSVWQGIGGGMDAAVLAVAAMPTGDLIASGIFSQRIGRFDGSVWKTLGSGLNAQALVLLPLNEVEFLAGGQFVFAGGAPASKIARWDGASWHALDTGVDQYVIALAAISDGELAVGGGFSTAGGLSSPGLAFWTVPGVPAVATQPQSVTTCSWSDASFTMAVTGDEPMVREWQAELDPGAWTTLSDGVLMHSGVMLATLSGASTDTLQLTQLTHFRDDRTLLNLRCSLFNGCGHVMTDVAELAVRVDCPGDATCDGVVELIDLAVLLSNYDITSGATPAQGDNDGDGDVDLTDLALLLSLFDTTCN